MQCMIPHQICCFILSGAPPCGKIFLSLLYRALSDLMIGVGATWVDTLKPLGRGFSKQFIFCHVSSLCQKSDNVLD